MSRALAAALAAALLSAAPRAWAADDGRRPPSGRAPRDEVSLGALTPFSSVYLGLESFRLDDARQVRPVAIGRSTFSAGIGVEANSMLSYALEGRYSRFEARVGVSATALAFYKDDKVRFEVYGDDALLYSGPGQGVAGPPAAVSVDVSGRQCLILRTVGPLSKAEDPRLAVWADAHLRRSGAGVAKTPGRPKTARHAGVGGDVETDPLGKGRLTAAEISYLVRFIEDDRFPLGASLAIYRKGAAARADLEKDLHRVAGSSGDVGTPMMTSAEPVVDRVYRIDKTLPVLRAHPPSSRFFFLAWRAIFLLICPVCDK